MRVLTLGGTRFMGRRLVERLLARGDDVTVATRGVTADPFGGAVTRVVADRLVPGALAAALDGRRAWDAAVDFVGLHGASSREAAACLAGRVGTFVHVSSAAVYEVVARGRGGPYVEADSDAPPARDVDEGAAGYAMRKREAERALLDAHAARGFPAVILRPPFVEGPWDPTLRTWRYLLWLRSGAPIPLPGGGRQRVGRVYRDDVVAAVLACLEAGARVHGRAFNVAQDETPTLRGYLERLAAAAGAAPRFADVPEPALAGAARAWHGFLVPGGADLELDCGAARRELGFSPTPLDDWLAATCAWLDGPENPFTAPADPPWRPR